MRTSKAHPFFMTPLWMKHFLQPGFYFEGNQPKADAREQSVDRQ